jgi:hypothetical protein
MIVGDKKRNDFETRNEQKHARRVADSYAMRNTITAIVPSVRCRQRDRNNTRVRFIFGDVARLPVDEKTIVATVTRRPLRFADANRCRSLSSRPNDDVLRRSCPRPFARHSCRFTATVYECCPDGYRTPRPSPHMAKYTGLFGCIIFFFIFPFQNSFGSVRVPGPHVCVVTLDRCLNVGNIRTYVAQSGSRRKPENVSRATHLLPGATVQQYIRPP